MIVQSFKFYPRKLNVDFKYLHEKYPERFDYNKFDEDERTFAIFIHDMDDLKSEQRKEFEKIARGV